MPKGGDWSVFSLQQWVATGRVWRSGGDSRVRSWCWPWLGPCPPGPLWKTSQGPCDVSPTPAKSRKTHPCNCPFKTSKEEQVYTLKFTSYTQHLNSTDKLIPMNVYMQLKKKLSQYTITLPVADLPFIYML